jgi:hypothetical protein
MMNRLLQAASRLTFCHASAAAQVAGIRHPLEKPVESVRTETTLYNNVPQGP